MRCFPLFIVLISACTPGSLGPRSQNSDPQVDGGPGSGSSDGITGDDTDVEDLGAVTLTLSPGATDLELGDTHLLQATVASVDGFAGNVTLTGDAPSGWTVSFSPSSTVVLQEDQSTAIDVSVSIATDGSSGAQSLAINASSNLGILSQTAAYQVANVATMAFENGTGPGSHTYTPLQIRLGTTVRFVNRDTGASHRIHAPGDYTLLGFPHEDGDMAPAAAVGADGGSYEVTINAAGVYDQWYCHNHEGGGGNAITVVE